MLLAFERNVSNGHTFLAQGFDHHLGLVRRHYFVFQTLKENHRTRQSIREVDRRSFDIEVSALGVWTNQTVGVARFEFVRIQFQRFEIAHAVVTRARFEVIPKRQRAQCSVTAGAAAIDHQTIAVNFAVRRQKPRALHAIIDIDYAPGAIQSLAIVAAIARAAAIIHIEHGDAAARPILNTELKRRNRR